MEIRPSMEVVTGSTEVLEANQEVRENPEGRGSGEIVDHGLITPITPKQE